MKVAGSAGLALGSLGFPAIVRAASGTRTVIVLGIDGMDPNLLLRLVKQGKMPNSRHLMEQGSFTRLGTSNPPQSPVAWSNFISGTNPGGHGIYDFIARDPSTLKPYLSTSRILGAQRTLRLGDWKIPLSGRKMVNLRKGPTFWTDLQNHGVDCTVFRMPANFPPTGTRARTLSGLGTPDIHGSYGIFTFYTDKKDERTRDVPGGRIERVRVRDHVIDCVLPGVTNTLDAKERKVNVAFRVFVDPVNPAAKISIQETEFILSEGEWSDWIRIRFPILPHLAEIPGICRFFLKRARNGFALYVSPVNIDPAEPSLPISTPEGYSRRLVRDVGFFHTQGMPQDTSALSAGVLNDAEYRQQATFVLNERLRFFEHEFGRFERGFFFFYFSSLDLNSHAFWRTVDSAHPLHSPGLRKKHGDFLPWLYAEMDKVIGRAMQRLDDQTLLMVISDHGFSSFRRQFNLNSWLMDNGYAAPIRNALRGRAGYFADLDWPRTRAYGLGLNALYLNIGGREPSGIVSRGEESRALAEELIARLTAVVDPTTGEHVISNVYRPSEIYSGPYVENAPDLLVCYGVNYRASWDTVLGKYPREHIIDNTDPWSGDHATDSSLVPGVFLSNRRINTDHPALHDLAPSILAEFGVPQPAGMTGKRVT